MKTVRRVTMDAFGWGAIAIGAAGVLLPVIPGIVFLLLGLYLLSVHSLRFRRLLERQLARFPRLAPVVERLDRGVKRLFNVGS